MIIVVIINYYLERGNIMFWNFIWITLLTFTSSSFTGNPPISAAPWSFQVKLVLALVIRGNNVLVFEKIPKNSGVNTKIPPNITYWQYKSSVQSSLNSIYVKLRANFVFYSNMAVDPEKFRKNLLNTTMIFLNIGGALARTPVNMQNGELFNNSDWILAVKYFCKALHLRYLRWP